MSVAATSYFLNRLTRLKRRLIPEHANEPRAGIGVLSRARAFPYDTIKILAAYVCRCAAARTRLSRLSPHGTRWRAGVSRRFRRPLHPIRKGKGVRRVALERPPLDTRGTARTPGAVCRAGPRTRIAAGRCLPAARIWRTGEAGSVLALVVLCMPAFIMLAGLALDCGLLFVMRQELQAIADFGALAGVQEVDLEALSAGERRFLPQAPVLAATQYVRQNVASASRPWLKLEQVDVEARTYEPDPGQEVFHHRDGRPLKDPTVCVTVRAEIRSPLIGLLRGPLRLEAHADASILPRNE